MRALLKVWFLLLCLLFLPFGARGEPARDIFLNERVTVPADGVRHAYVFSPTANNIYDFGAFGDGFATASLYLDGEGYLFESTPFPFEARLIADRTYTIEVAAENGDMQLEIMRKSNGRTFYNPVSVASLDESVGKIISRAYDTHWLKFTAPKDGFYAIRSVSETNLAGWLLDQDGRRVAMNDNLYTPYGLDFRLEANLRAGETYILRVSAVGEGTGAYRIVWTLPEDDVPMPENVLLDTEYIELRAGETYALTRTLSPANALHDPVYLSSNPSVASVNEMGVITAHAAGEAQIILAEISNLEARVLVVVEPTPVEAIVPALDAVAYSQGAYFQLEYTLSPANANARGLEMVSSDPEIVSIDRRNRLFAKAEGTADVTIYAENRRVSATVHVRITPPAGAYRALVLGENKYLDGRSRLGSINTTQGVTDMLALLRLDGARYQTTTRFDSTAVSALGAIKTAFQDATARDTSLLYVNCHGGVTNGHAWIEFHDGSRLTARALARALRKVPGTIVLLIDCCNSGAFLSLDTRSDFNGHFIQAFSARGRSAFLSSKFQILTSTSAVSDSYRISFEGKDSTEGAMATVFARSLCEGGGWNLITDRETRMRADLNQDNIVTLYEAYLYTKKRVRRYLAGQAGAQDVQIYPAGSGFKLFQK